jgi:hypothetical protein
MESVMSQSIWSLSAAAFVLVVAGCSDPVPPAPRGNLSFTLAGCTNYTGAVGPDRSEMNLAVRSEQLPALDGTEPGRRIEDGQDGSTVSCTVDGGDTNKIEATIFGTQSHPANPRIENVGINLTDGWIQKTETGGVGEAMISFHTGDVHYYNVEGTVCTLTLDSSQADNQFTVDAGRVYARFDCAELTDPPTKNCRASGAFVFERCKEE